MTWLTRLVATGLLALATAAQAHGPAKPVVPHIQKGPFPQLNLPERESRGQRAVELLGNRLPEVAAFYRRSPDQFRDWFLNDRSLRLDARGRVFVVDEIDAPLPATAPPVSSQGAIDGQLAPLDQTFALHSRPGAQRTIYLNFKGATLTGTAWNTSAFPTINAAPFDLDGSPGTFSTAELQRIQYIWQRVAEDFAPFNVDVTTEQPPADALTRSGSTDQVFGTTVLITNNANWYSCSCGGVAYLGIFDDTSNFYKPALVFYNQLGSDEKNIAEAASHEAGHNMGLGHDGTSTSGYYSGHGTSGTTGWAPIMGVGYNKPVVQWSKGEYTGANNTQDDYVVMQSNGLPIRPDDHADTLAGATVLNGTSSAGKTLAKLEGVIERSDDIDVFVFSANPGAVTLTLQTAARSANLDAQIALRDSAGNVLASANPTEALNASLTFTLPQAGTYYVQVNGTSKGNPAVDGYSRYGSVGQYALSADFFTPGNQMPTSVISASATSGTAPLVVNLSGANSSDADGSIVAYDWSFSEGGTATGSTTSRTYTTPGSYVAQLRVTDNGGLSSLSSVTITVGAPSVPMSIGNIMMSRAVARNGQSRATAVVPVLSNGVPVSGVTVTGTWSGVTSGAVTGTTGTNGTVTFTSGNSRAATGNFVFTVTGATRSGYNYVPGSNLETSDSIAVR
jgi:PKD domain/Bacterial pre-peptidase C-terminal domain/Metallo-peptidase family M12B Reprolysin-like